VTTVADAGDQRPSGSVPHSTGRPSPLDVLLATVLTASAVAVVLLAPKDPGHRGSDWLALAFALASGLPLLGWRTRPLACLCIGCALVVANTAAGYPVGGVQYPVWLTLYSVLATAADGRRRSAAVGLVAATVAAWALIDRDTVNVDSLVGVGILFVLAILGGQVSRTRRALAEADRAQLVLAAAQEAGVRERITLQERARLARELHDAVGHAVNVMVMQAGVARHVFDDRPDFARDALGRIETVGRDALVELDGVLRVLRSTDDDPHDNRSTASLAGLDTLCDRIRATGHPVELRREPVALTPGGERAAYRIVQEAVTNAARHGGPGQIEVTVAPTPSIGAGTPRVQLTVRNPIGPGPATPGTGRGLVNMRERARLEGGELEAGPDGDSWFLVRASLPAQRPTDQP
jgi:signal transduction histidine kinase